MKKIDFISNPNEYKCSSDYVAFISQVNGEDSLHRKLSEVLKFPSYYGENWNALYDCLRDFSWINQKGIALVHITVPILPEIQLKIYIEILLDSIKYWNDSNEHNLKVIFPLETETLISRVVNQ
jgi:RNAse (barnase) inhibitor barstar